ncbi:cysteine hydrolase family protein [soil metagenome]
MTTTENPTEQRTALIVIDVQCGNVADAYEREAVIGRIGELITRAKDAGSPVIWIQHGSGPLVPGSDAWQIVEELRPGAEETVVPKLHLDSFADTTLRAELDALGVTSLVICGAATDACIRTTTMRALVEGYDTTLVSDAHTTDIGPWDLPLPNGEMVPIGAREMIAYTNFFIEDTTYPGVVTAVTPTADVSFQRSPTPAC